MTIKEMEQRTGLTRSNIRFYEKEELISPLRDGKNGYRDYSEEDVKTIRKVAYLRTLGISVEEIRRISRQEADLHEVLKEQSQQLEQQLSDLQQAKRLCERMLSSKEALDYETLDVEKYVTDLDEYWNQNNGVLKMDSVRFFYMWGGSITWAILTILCLIVAMLSIGSLPAEIPIQWEDGVVSSLVDKRFMFAFPVVCIIIRVVLRPFVWRWLKIKGIDSEAIADYLANYACFVALSVEVFIILFVKEILKYVTIVLFIDTFVLLGLLFGAVRRVTKSS